jgi:hypothetical protein
MLRGKSTDIEVEVRAVRTLRIDSSDGNCAYAVGV